VRKENLELAQADVVKYVDIENARLLHAKRLAMANVTKHVSGWKESLVISTPHQDSVNVSVNAQDGVHLQKTRWWKISNENNLVQITENVIEDVLNKGLMQLSIAS